MTYFHKFYFNISIFYQNSLRLNCDWLRGQYASCSGKDRAELFPARWRAGERGSAAALLEAAAPAGAPALRRAINDAAMDVMYYTSPVYGKQVRCFINEFSCNPFFITFIIRIGPRRLDKRIEPFIYDVHG